MHPTDPPFSARAHGKLLLTGEYAVLDGAAALAVPTRFGQSLTVAGSAPFSEKKGRPTGGQLSWRSLEADGSCWFSAEYDLADFNLETTNDVPTAVRLAEILRETRHQKPGFLEKEEAITAEARVDFPRSWGLGTSSTLLSLVAEWAGADPYLLLEKTFGGSGYDIACARARGPIVFQKKAGGQPSVEAVAFDPVFRNCLYFIYLGKKQDSREAIHRYRSMPGSRAGFVKKISQLTARFLAAASLDELDEAIREHEQLVSGAIGLPRARDLFFNGFWGEVKSLGGWGGDFALATSGRGAEETGGFFNQAGFPVVVPFDEMILKNDPMV